MDAEWMQNPQVQRNRIFSQTGCRMFSDRLFLGALVWCFVGLTICSHGDSSSSLGEVLRFWAELHVLVPFVLIVYVQAEVEGCTKMVDVTLRDTGDLPQAIESGILLGCSEHIPCDLM